MKKERGITLVALVITVIIMLILAGVALSLITGEEGLFARANHSVQKYKEASQEEADIVNQLLNSEYIGGKQSEPTLITELAKNGTLKVGDYIDYDAGTWEESDLELIDDSIKAYGGSLNGTTGTEEEGNKKLGVNSANPTSHGQFGGFSIGDSRNNSSTPVEEYWIPRTSGWRIWSINEGTGEVTIIHAGNPEIYYHAVGKAEDSINILRNRECSMYESKYAKEGSAHILKGSEAAEWYTKNCLTDEEKASGLVYELESYGEDIDNDGNRGDNNFYKLSAFVSKEEMPVIEVLENHTYYFLASASSTNYLFGMNPNKKNIFSYNSSDGGYGFRIILSLKTNILLEPTTGTEDGWNTWHIVEN